MKKKYHTKDLVSLNQRYLSKNVCSSGKVLHFYPALEEITSSWIHKTYLKDFALKYLAQKDGGQYSYLFSSFDINAFKLESLQVFFAKKNLSIPKLGHAKISNYLRSKQTKGEKRNKNLTKTLFHEVFDFSDDRAFSLFLRKEFFSLRRQGKIKQTKKIGYRSFDLQANVPIERVIFKEETVDQYHLKYFIEGKGTALNVVAFDVDLIFGDVALLVHPGDKRYKQYIGKNVLIPFINKPIPVIGDSMIDISKDYGIKRVNPFIDQESIQFAEKHGLPLDHAIFDMQGNYTTLVEKFAGKSRMEFKTNILDFLYDIANIGGVTQGETTIPYSRTTGERLYPYLLDTFSLDFSQEQPLFKQWLENHKDFLDHDDEELLFQILDEDCNINAYAVSGESVPVYFQGQYQLALLPFSIQDYSTSLYYLFDHFIFFLAVTFYAFPSGNISQFISYLISFEDQLPFFFETVSEYSFDQDTFSAFSSFFESLKMGEEESLEKIKNLIENSHLYSISSEIVEFTFLQKQPGALVPMIFSDVFLQMMKGFFYQSQGISLSEHRFFSQEDYAFFVFYGMFSLYKNHKIPYQNFALSSYNFETLPQENRLCEILLQQYGDDIVRLNLLIDGKLDKEQCNKYAIFLGKIWNGIRYRKQNFPPFASFDGALKIALNDKDPINIRMLCELSDLYQNYQMRESYQKTLQFFPEIVSFIQDKFLSRYFELKKEDKTPENSAIFSLCFAFILDFLYPFVPTYLRSLLETIHQKYPLFHSFSLESTKSNDCVRLYNLWHLFSTFKESLGLKKHDPIKIFLKSDPGVLDLYKSYETYFQKMFVIQEQILLRLHENEPEGYPQDTFETSTIGIKKGESKIIGKKHLIADLEHHKKEKEQYLEYLKNLYLSGYPTFGATIQELKQDIENIEIEIQKLKKNLE